jgi:hypothetical protein
MTEHDEGYVHDSPLYSLFAVASDDAQLRVPRTSETLGYRGAKTNHLVAGFPPGMSLGIAGAGVVSKVKSND